MDLWIVLSVAAAAAQALRFMVQKQLRQAGLSTAGATYARFLYSAPLILVAMLLYLAGTGQGLPATGGRFWLFALGGGLMQVVATMCVVALFSLRNFAVGITFKKTEVILTAVAGLAILGDAVSPLGWAALVVGLCGVLLLSEPPGASGGMSRVFNRAAGLGLLSGLCFALSAVWYRGATLALATDDLAIRAGWTLAMVTVAQTAGMTLWLAWRERGQVGAVLRSWRRAAPVGILSMAGSFCWFAAFSLQSAAYVFAVGQIELIFSLLVSVFVFRETIERRELWGMSLLAVSILGIAFTG